MTASVTQFLTHLLGQRLTEPARIFLISAVDEIAAGSALQRFGVLFSLASRHARRQPLNLDREDLDQAERLVPGWRPEAWNLLELLRVALILARPDLEQTSFADEFEALFRFADEGETCALYRSLPLLPAGERFANRAAEGCRTNMLTVFEAIALDSPYPVRHFEDTAWHQLVIKALFLDLPVYRIVGLDRRMTAELTRMALDWAEERTSAGRPFHIGLWLCLGPHDQVRVKSLVEAHWPVATTLERRAMALALTRSGLEEFLDRRLQDEPDPALRIHLQGALSGSCDQLQFAPLFSQPQ